MCFIYQPMDMTDASRDGQTALALRLTRHLSPGDNDNATGCGRNVAFLPLSIHAVLALVAAGARGATLAQLLSFLGAPSAADLAALGCRITDIVLANRADFGGPRVLFGGGIWVDEHRGALKKTFRDTAANSYKSEARTVNFAEKPVEAVEMINNWVKKATNNLIGSIFSVNHINPATDLVLANAAYFKGKWSEPFDSLFTMPETFHRLDGSSVSTEFMTMYNPQYVSSQEGFKVLKLPYRKGKGDHAKSSLDAGEYETQYSMFVFLPDDRRGLATMVDVITAAPGYLYSILPKTKTESMIRLKLPKFEISFQWGDLKRDLCQLGLSLPFTPEVCDLRDMCEKDDERLPRSFLVQTAHMAIVKVSEVGTEAVAASRVICGGWQPPPDIVEFVADHPFMFFIMEERSGVIVFAGHVLDPTK